MTTHADPRSATPSKQLPSEDPAVPLGLVTRLCAALADENVVYCHFKSNEAIHRSMTGDNDLDLLVARPDQDRFVHVLARLGFKAAKVPSRDVPAVVHYYGLDVASGRLVHVHAYFQLMVGDDTTKNFRLPVEQAYLASRHVDGLFPIPAADFELAVLVLRLVLKHATWDAMLQLRGAPAPNETRELAWLEARAEWPAVEAVVAQHLPFLSDVWPMCRRAVEPDCPRVLRIRASLRLMRALRACARRAGPIDLWLRLVRRGTWGARRYLLRRPVRKRLVAGGAVVALVGGDGAGKSTAVDGLASWLSGAFVVRRVHLGKLPPSLTSVVVKGALIVGRWCGLLPELVHATKPPSDLSKAPSTAWIAWHTMTARDRYLLYGRARRVAANGGIVLCDRYPLAQLRSMDGVRTAWAAGLPGLSRLDRALVRREAQYYAAFGCPDVLAVLLVDPEVAVTRKTDEDQHYVRRRSTEVWNAPWEPHIVRVDASRSASAVLADLRAAVWERL